MKRMMWILSALAACFVFTGCVQLQTHTTVEKDGSGTTSLTMSMSTEVADALLELQEIDSSSEMDFPKFDDLKKEDIEKAGKKHGVKVKKFDKAVVDGRQTLDMFLEFEDLKGFSYVIGKVMGGGKGDGGGMGIFDAGDGNLVLRQATYDFPDEAAPEEKPEPETPAEMDPEKMQKQMAIMGKLMGAIGELAINLKVTVPGDVVSSNAPVVEGRTSIWNVDSSNMMTQQNDMDPEIVFSGKGLKIKPLE